MEENCLIFVLHMLIKNQATNHHHEGLSHVTLDEWPHHENKRSPRMSRLSLCSIVVLVAAASGRFAAANEVGFIDDFALAKDSAEALCRLRCVACLRANQRRPGGDWQLH